jgi:hypoxanthine phosphoribosyltransferase
MLTEGERRIQLRLLYTRDEIHARVKFLAERISRDFKGKSPLLVVVLKGAFIFAADLVRMLNLPVEIDFITLDSYEGRESTGRVRITKDLTSHVTGKDLLVIEDIVDTGMTLDFLLGHLWAKDPQSIKVCTLIDKRERRKIAMEADYAGIACKEGFLVGYGLDLDEGYRELDAIYEVEGFHSSGGLNDNPM